MLDVVYAECLKYAIYAECRHAECLYTESRGANFLVLHKWHCCSILLKSKRMDVNVSYVCDALFLDRVELIFWRYDTQHNDIQHNDTQHNI